MLVGDHHIGMLHLDGDLALAGLVEPFESPFEEFDLLDITQLDADNLSAVGPVSRRKKIAHRSRHRRP